MRILIKIALLVAIILNVSCAPEAGSKAWCEAMDEKSAGDWTANEAADYAQSCVFRSED
jgi:hypothetical protein